MKKLITTIFITTIILITVTSVQASPEIDEGVDIMIVIDKSWSMSWNDPELETLEATHHLLNLSLGTGSRIGFVVYNDTIVAYQGLREIESLDDVNDMMRELRGIEISRGTDVGLAMQTARRQLELDRYRAGQTAIIVFSDGDYEFEVDNPNRNQQDVSADVEEVLSTISYPIFTVQYSVLEYQNQAPKNTWGPITGGANFNAMTPAEMIDAVNEIYRLTTEMAEETISAAWLEYEANRIHEHQLIIPVPSATERERAEVVEVTLMGGGEIQEIILPEDNDHITISMSGTNHIIRITDPEQESYTIYYLTSNASPFEISTHTRMVEIPRAIQWDIIAISISVAVALTIFVLLARRLLKRCQVKRKYPSLNGTLECYFMEVPTGTKDIPIQSWSASFLAANNKVSLDKLLKNVSLRSKMPEAEKIFASINDDNTIAITNKAGIVCFKDGTEVTDKQITLRNGEGLYMVFQKNTIEIELRARQSSLS